LQEVQADKLVHEEQLDEQGEHSSEEFKELLKNPDLHSQNIELG
jgi:hypothetical protein